METKQLIAEVAARNGIRIDEDDPAFCIVTLNQLMLEESARTVVADIRKATRDFEQAVDRLQARLGTVLGQSQKNLVASLHRELNKDWITPRLDQRQFQRRIMVGLLSIVIAFVLGVVMGVIFS